MTVIRRIMSAQLAGNILLGSLGVLAVFHILVLLRLLPTNIVWGGAAAAAPANLLALELIALAVTLLFAAVIAAKVGYIRAGGWARAVSIGVWLIFAYLILNTVGNLAAGLGAESLLFAPLTLILAACALRLAIEAQG